MLSPVSIDSSIAESPDTTTPSVGIFSPGLTRMMSPTLSSSTGISSVDPFLITVAERGLKPASFLIACEVLDFARASRNLPSIMSVTIMDEPSKYKCGIAWPSVKNPGRNVATTEYRYADIDPIATRVFMSDVFCLSALKAPIRKRSPTQKTTGVVSAICNMAI